VQARTVAGCGGRSRALAVRVHQVTTAGRESARAARGAGRGARAGRSLARLLPRLGRLVLDERARVAAAQREHGLPRPARRLAELEQDEVLEPHAVRAEPPLPRGGVLRALCGRGRLRGLLLRGCQRGTWRGREDGLTARKTCTPFAIRAASSLRVMDRPLDEISAIALECVASPGHCVAESASART
jgi:hypothetical protein